MSLMLYLQRETYLQFFRSPWSNERERERELRIFVIFGDEFKIQFEAQENVLNGIYL